MCSSTSSTVSLASGSDSRYDAMYDMRRERNTREKHSSSSLRRTQSSPNRDIGTGTRPSSNSSGGVHNRLYAHSRAKQVQGREKREQIAMSLAPRAAPPPKKISAKKASSLFDRLYDSGVQKQISLGRKKNATREITPKREKISSPIISTTQANSLYNRLHNEAMAKQLKEMALSSQRPKSQAKVMSSREANSLYERLYCETTLTLHRARFADKG